MLRLPESVSNVKLNTTRRRSDLGAPLKSFGLHMKVDGLMTLKAVQCEAVAWLLQPPLAFLAALAPPELSGLAQRGRTEGDGTLVCRH